MGRILEAGMTVDRYEVESFIGDGGLSEVFKVTHRDLRSSHALKVLAVDLPNISARILAEGRVQAQLNHPNVVPVSDIIDVRGRPGLVMEYVPGSSLRDWLRNNSPTLEETLVLFAGIVRGVRAAHRLSIIHRDLKPENILLAETEAGLVPKVMDFGLVKVLSQEEGDTQTGMMMGTPQYMAPEQIRDASRVDQRADLFSLGCILYGMTCGVPAFRGSDMVTILNKTAQGDYPDPQTIRPDIPDHIAAVIRSLLSVAPEDRMTDCDAVLEAIFPEEVAATGSYDIPFIESDGTGPVEADAPTLDLDPISEYSFVAERIPANHGAMSQRNARLQANAMGWLAAGAGVLLIGVSVFFGLTV
ncbi:MAG: serine/threonine-protein kinase [Myxococcota bacterium]|jgi:serine/threonine-protein kinase